MTDFKLTMDRGDPTTAAVHAVESSFYAGVEFALAGLYSAVLAADEGKSVVIHTEIPDAVSANLSKVHAFGDFITSLAAALRSGEVESAAKVVRAMIESDITPQRCGDSK